MGCAASAPQPQSAAQPKEAAAPDPEPEPEPTGPDFPAFVDRASDAYTSFRSVNCLLKRNDCVLIEDTLLTGADYPGPVDICQNVPKVFHGPLTLDPSTLSNVRKQRHAPSGRVPSVTPRARLSCCAPLSSKLRA